MKELKKEFRWFNIMEYEKEENYLSKRHQEGWKFKRVTFPGVYTFERCESEKVFTSWITIKKASNTRWNMCGCLRIAAGNT